MPTSRLRVRALLALGVTALAPLLALGPASPASAEDPSPSPSATPTCSAISIPPCPLGSRSPSPSASPTASPTPRASDTPSPTSSPAARRTRSPRPAATSEPEPAATESATPLPDVEVGGVVPETSTPTPLAGDERASSSGDGLTRLLVVVIGAAVLLGIGGATGLWMTRSPR